MAMSDLEQRIDELLADDPALAPHWTDPPQTFIGLPPPQPPSGIAVVWLCLGPEDLSVEQIWNVIFSVVQKTLEAGYLSELKRFDIVPRFYKAGGPAPERLMRINIDTNSAGTILQLESNCLLQREPAPGIVCGWYVKPEYLPLPTPE